MRATANWTFRPGGRDLGGVVLNGLDGVNLAAFRRADSKGVLTEATGKRILTMVMLPPEPFVMLVLTKYYSQLLLLWPYLGRSSHRFDYRRKGTSSIKRVELTSCCGFLQDKRKEKRKEKFPGYLTIGAPPSTPNLHDGI